MIDVNINLSSSWPEKRYGARPVFILDLDVNPGFDKETSKVNQILAFAMSNDIVEYAAIYHPNKQNQYGSRRQHNAILMPSAVRIIFNNRPKTAIVYLSTYPFYAALADQSDDGIYTNS